MKIINQKLKVAVNEKHVEIRKLEKRLQQYQSPAEVSRVSVYENEKTKLNFFIQYLFKLFLQKIVEILECLKYGSPTKKYSEVIRQFCMGLDYLSPAAYRYIRRVSTKTCQHQKLCGNGIGQ